MSIETSQNNFAIQFGDADAKDTTIIDSTQNDEQTVPSRVRRSLIYPLKRLRKAFRRKSKWVSNYDSKTCPICLEGYKDGEKIGGSKNPNCDHFFHLTCVVDWLRYRDECALCRATFINFEHNGISNTN